MTKQNKTDLFTHFELLKLRKSIGATHGRMAELIGLGGYDPRGKLHKMEKGADRITMPQQKLLTYMMQGVDYPAETSKLLPETLVHTNIQKDSLATSWVFRTRYPRLLCVTAWDKFPGQFCAQVDFGQWLYIGLVIDQPVNNDQAITAFNTCVKDYKAYIKALYNPEAATDER